jgi:hypothetical protein
MAFEEIEIGTIPNDTEGDTLRAGGIKINNNFAKAVEGAASSTSGRVAVFADGSGKLLQNGAKLEADLVTGPASVAAGRVAAFNGTTGKVVQEGVGDGAESTPSVTFASDLNTGMWRPAANTIAFSTNGAHRMRIDSSGKVGIGTTSPDVILHTSDGSNATRIIVDNTANATARAGIFMRTFSSGTEVSNATIRTNNTGNLTIFTGTTNVNAAERMRIAADGNVGIGTTSPTVKLDVFHTGLVARFVATNGNVNQVGFSSASDGANHFFIGAPAINQLQFSNSVGVERMRIDASGNIGIGTTGQFGTGARVIGIANATTVPTTNPTGGGVLYVEGGALKYRGSSGTVTTIANA